MTMTLPAEGRAGNPTEPDPTHPPHRAGENPVRLHRPGRRAHTAPTALPAAPSPQAMAEATALIAGRTYGASNLPLSGDIPPNDIIRALLGITIALLCDQFPDDHGAAFLETLGADAAAHPTNGDHQP